MKVECGGERWSEREIERLRGFCIAMLREAGARVRLAKVNAGHGQQLEWWCLGKLEGEHQA